MSSNNIPANLTEAEEWVLDALHNDGHPLEKWLRPMDVGRPSSFVQRGLAGLVRKGLTERKHRPASTAWLPHSRKLDDRLWELRFRCERVNQRITYTVEPEHRVITLTTFRKQRSNERKEVKRARNVLRRRQGKG